jgi:hypothetical protein
MATKPERNLYVPVERYCQASVQFVVTPEVSLIVYIHYSLFSSLAFLTERTSLALPTSISKTLVDG